MMMLYKFAEFPKNQKLLLDINTGAHLLFEKLSALNVESIDVSDYNKRYLKRYQLKLRTHLQRLTYLLVWVLHNQKKPLSDIVMVDYGGGSGILTLLAKACGVGTVIYNDIFDVSCRDAEEIGKELDFKADHFVAGDIDVLNKFVSRNSITTDALVSCDVLEHIYSPESFFKSLQKLSDRSFNYVISTHANPLNPVISRKLMKQQFMAENVERDAGYGHKTRDSLGSFNDIRREIIANNFSSKLSQDEINQLAKCTRGMIESDIKESVANYLVTNQLPKLLSHPTNTCDPNTGNWADRLSNPFEIRDLLKQSGFSSQVLSCYHGNPKNATKNILANILDIMIRVFGKQGLRLASYFLLYGESE